jgi:hypothetical protein
MGRTLSWGLAVLVVAAAGCSDDDGGKLPPGMPSSARGADGLSGHEALRLGTVLSIEIAQNAVMSREMVVRGVYAASALGGTGRVTRTGTLRQAPNGQFAYESSPADRLVVVLPDARHEFVVHDAQGNAQAATADAFLAANHTLHYVHRRPDLAEIEIRANRVGMGWAAELDGWFLHADERYDLDLRAEGGTYFESNMRAGTESRTDYTLKGTVLGPRAQMTVDERHFFELVSHGADTVTYSRDTNANVLTTGSDTYRWIDVDVVKVFRSYGARMRPVFDTERQWKVEGQVRRNEEPYGRYKMDVERLGVTARREYQGNVLIVIDTPDGPFEVQSFRGS